MSSHPSLQEVVGEGDSIEKGDYQGIEEDNENEEVGMEVSANEGGKEEGENNEILDFERRSHIIEGDGREKKGLLLSFWERVSENSSRALKSENVGQQKECRVQKVAVIVEVGDGTKNNSYKRKEVSGSKATEEKSGSKKKRGVRETQNSASTT